MKAMLLAAGRGERLRPLTDTRPKALLPVDGVPLVDLAIERLRPHVAEVAVNAHYLHDQLERHLAGRDVHVSVEQPVALGTAGALGALRDWIAGRDVLVTNADAWYGDQPGLVSPADWITRDQLVTECKKRGFRLTVEEL